MLALVWLLAAVFVAFPVIYLIVGTARTLENSILLSVPVIGFERPTTDGGLTGRIIQSFEHLFVVLQGFLLLVSLKRRLRLS